MDKRSKRAASLADDTNADPIATAVAAALAGQQQQFQCMIDNQMKAFQACIQSAMETTNKRFDAFLIDTTRDLTDCEVRIQCLQGDLRVAVHRRRPRRLAEHGYVQ